VKRYRGSAKRAEDWAGAGLFLVIVALIAFIAWGIVVTVRPAAGSELPGTDLLARMAYSEARSDGVRGMTAVSHVALNRLKQPERFGRTLDAVLRAPRQFALRPVRRADPSWPLALRVAAGAVDGTLPDLTKGSVYFYRCDRPPRWAAKRTPTVRVGRHCFRK
jgi:N-acetylmuramoyl-L-alanine amidase